MINITVIFLPSINGAQRSLKPLVRVTLGMSFKGKYDNKMWSRVR
jgi:hypothetical protein